MIVTVIIVNGVIADAAAGVESERSRELLPRPLVCKYGSIG
jgi:hypothetical protein